jgi:hypothetical protein
MNMALTGTVLVLENGIFPDCPHPMNDQRLTRKLIGIVLLKLLVLFALWWVFFRDQGVAVDAGMMGKVIQSTRNGETQDGH